MAVTFTVNVSVSVAARLSVALSVNVAFVAVQFATMSAVTLPPALI